MKLSSYCHILLVIFLSDGIYSHVSFFVLYKGAVVLSSCSLAPVYPYVCFYCSSVFGLMDCNVIIVVWIASASYK